MRQWMVDPKLMCRKHLNGEHVEHHMFIGSMKQKKSVSGYIRKNLLEPLALKSRHEELVSEMIRRGYKHNSDIMGIDLHGLISYLSISEQTHVIDKESAKKDLFSRCKECGVIHE